MIPALQGVRIVEIGEGLAVAYAGKLLVDLGADVIKVERPLVGDRTRRLGPFPGGVFDSQQSGMFHYLNGSKRSVALDVEDSSNRDWIHSLVESADIVLVAGTVESIRNHGLSEESVRTLHPRVVLTTITPFGFTGPLSDAAAHDITLCALGAISNMVGEANRAPLTPPLSLSSYQGGLAAASGSLLALFARRQTGRGQHVDISPLDVWATVHQGSILANDLNFAMTVERAGRRRLGTYPFQLFKAKDGWMCMIAREARQWENFIDDIIGDPRLTTNDRYRDRAAMGLKYPEEVDELLAPWFEQHTRSEIFALCREHRVPFAPVRRIDEAAECEQLASRGFFVDAPTGENGMSIRIPGIPFLMRDRIQVRDAAPALGQHTNEVLAELSPFEATSLPASEGEKPADPVAPLAGVRVLDLSWVLAGPLVGRLLADAGAEVIKVESRSRPDNTRRAGYIRSKEGETGPSADPLNRAPMFHMLNAGKKSISINLRSSEGAEVLKRLVRCSDVLLENYSPGVMRRLGFDYESLAKERSQLVMLSMSGTGQEGPLSDVSAYAPTVTALGGFDSVVGYEGEELMGTMGLNFADSIGGLFGFYAVLAALWSRQERGLGQLIDYSEMEGVLALCAQPFVDYFMNGIIMAPAGNEAPDGSPYGVFETNTQGEWVAIGVTSDEEWNCFCSATATEAWSRNDEYATVEGRRKHRRSLDVEVAKYVKLRIAQEIIENLREAGVAVAPVYGVRQQVEDQHFWSRNLFLNVEVPGIGDLVIYGTPWRLVGTPTNARRGAPNLGEHTHEVLTGLLDLPEDEIVRLSELGILA